MSISTADRQQYVQLTLKDSNSSMQNESMLSVLSGESDFLGDFSLDQIRNNLRNERAAVNDGPGSQHNKFRNSNQFYFSQRQFQTIEGNEDDTNLIGQKTH
jgi:hypothetical protein